MMTKPPFLAEIQMPKMLQMFTAETSTCVYSLFGRGLISSRSVTNTCDSSSDKKSFEVHCSEWESERKRPPSPKHNQLWQHSDECCISTTHNAHTSNPQSHHPKHLSFSDKHLQIITEDLTEHRVCLGDLDFTTTSICQQTTSIMI